MMISEHCGAEADYRPAPAGDGDGEGFAGRCVQNGIQVTAGLQIAGNDRFTCRMRRQQ